jgi:hypothetical protein
VCGCACVVTWKGAAPFRDWVWGSGGGAARPARPYALQAPSAAHHALPVSGQSSAVHVSLCRCVSCALCTRCYALWAWGFESPRSCGGCSLTATSQAARTGLPFALPAERPAAITTCRSGSPGRCPAAPWPRWCFLSSPSSLPPYLPTSLPPYLPTYLPTSLPT